MWRSIELGVFGFDAEKKAIDRSALEFRHVEDRMMRLRQPIENQARPRKRRDGRDQDGQLKVTGMKFGQLLCGARPR